MNPGNAGNITTFLTTGFLGFSSGNQFPNLNPDGVFGGLQTGYDRQFGTWVLGAVADIQGADFTARRDALTTLAANGADTTEGLSAKITWFGTVRGKAGFAMGDWLAYGTGGRPTATPKAASVSFVHREEAAAEASPSPATAQRSRSAGAPVRASRRRSRATGMSASNISTLTWVVRPSRA